MVNPITMLKEIFCSTSLLSTEVQLIFSTFIQATGSDMEKIAKAKYEYKRSVLHFNPIPLFETGVPRDRTRISSP